MSQYVNKIRTNSGDLQIDYNALANLPTISNPNLLINSDFRNPINQRGQTNYSIPANIYTIDRWKVLSKEATLSVNDGYIKLSSISGPSYFIQKGENIPINDYMTVSINVKSLTGVLNVYIGSEHIEECFSIDSAGITTYTTTVKFPDFIQLNIEAIDDASVELYWAKVEQGTVATPFVPRLYAEELALCRRYYKKYYHAYFIGIAMVLADHIVLPLPQEPMRVGNPIFNILESTIFNPVSYLSGTFIELTADYAVADEQSQYVAFQRGAAQEADIGRIYGSFELDAEIY